MYEYIARRILLLAPVVLGAAVLIFFTMHILPGDVAQTILSSGGEGSVAPEALANLREQLGLNRPLHEQLLSWMWGVVRLDLGDSLWTGKPIVSELASRIPLSLELVIFGVSLSVLLGVPAGVFSAVRRESALDYAVRIAAYLGQAMPVFWLGILVIIFSVNILQWNPPLGYVDFFEDPVKNGLIMAAPVAVLGFRQTAVTARMTRSCILEVMREDYIRTARAKGLRESIVLWRHALRNAFLPVITIVFMEFAYLFGALIVLESVFTLPGMGRFLVDAIHHRDIPTVQAIILILAFVVAFMNFAQDLIYGWLDPRIRYS
ncbi:MAG: ABC transporter permease [Chloroflexi bacterium]|nr:ABC transporter permease [Chloroflexota bacterium]